MIKKLIVISLITCFTSCFSVPKKETMPSKKDPKNIIACHKAMGRCLGCCMGATCGACCLTPCGISCKTITTLSVLSALCCAVGDKVGKIMGEEYCKDQLKNT